MERDQCQLRRPRLLAWDRVEVDREDRVREDPRGVDGDRGREDGARPREKPSATQSDQFGEELRGTTQRVSVRLATEA